MSRVIYITVRTPLGKGEEFIVPEMLELISRKHALLIVPRSPSEVHVSQAEASELQSCCVYQPLLSRTFLKANVQGLAHNFKKCLDLLLRIFLQSGNISHLLKNLAVFPKALWLAQLAIAWQAEHLHAHWALSTATMAMIAGEITGIPWSFTAHRGDIVDNNMLDAKVQSASFVRFISESGLRLAQSILNKDLPANCHVIHMGVKLPEEPSPRKRDRERPFTIMCPANLLPVKGHTYLLQAIAGLKERGIYCRLFVLGQGPLAGDLQQLVEKFDIQDRVRFLGHLPHELLLNCYAEHEADLVVLASVDLGKGEHEGIPVALMEAMAYGIPVIATKTGGIPDLISTETGITVPPQDSHALAQAIESLVLDGALRRELSLSGLQRVKDAFNVEDVIKKMGLLIVGQKQDQIRA